MEDARGIAFLEEFREVGGGLAMEHFEGLLGGSWTGCGNVLGASEVKGELR